MNLQESYSKKNSILREIFFGSHPLSLLGHPYAINRSGLKQAVGVLAKEAKAGALLDVGCGVMPYRRLFPKNEPYEGLEIGSRHQSTNKLAKYFYDGGAFPVESGHYSCITCFQVLEHCENPTFLLKECFRALEDEGTLILTMPFMWPEHEQPWDFQRYTRNGLERTLKASGFEVRKIIRVNSGISSLIQLTIDWIDSLYRLVHRKVKYRPLRAFVLLSWRFLTAVPYTALNLLALMPRLTSDPIKDDFNCAKPQHQHRRPELYLDLAVIATKNS